MTTGAIEWQAEQVCGQCGEGGFLNRSGLAICEACGHEHGLSPWNLDPGERFEWIGGRLVVTAYAVAGE